MKQIRTQRSLSLSKLADISGVSKAMIGQIEREESSPTIATLWKLATGLDVSFSSLVGSDAWNESFRFPKLTDSNLIRNDVGNDGMLVSIIQAYEPHLGFEWFEITFPPEYLRNSEPHIVGTLEFVSVLEGYLEVLIGKDWEKLAPGQTIRFAADAPHGYRTGSNEGAKVHCIIHYIK
nr:XRE family transcriptional regulator [Sneathiella limimaris]